MFWIYLLTKRYKWMSGMVPQGDFDTNAPISIRVPYERGTQLRNLAEGLGLTVTDAIGALLDHGARTGLGTLAIPGFDITVKDHVIFVVDVAVMSFSAEQARSLASCVRPVASGRRPAMLYMDRFNTVEITRTGGAVVLKIYEHGAVVVQKTVSRGVAKAVADRIHDGAGELEAADGRRHTVSPH